MVSTEEVVDSAPNDLESKIIKQIEYYFGDINLAKDKFLKEVCSKDEGWVTLEMLLTFKRLNALSNDAQVIINALKKSNNNLIEISECETKIRRQTEKPLPEMTDDYRVALNERTVHAKGFDLEVTLDDLMSFCKQYGNVESIEMRRSLKNRKFKGCIFVIFSTKEEADNFINSEDVKYEGQSLLRENKVNYFARKQDYYQQRKNKSNANKNESVVKSENDASGDPVKKEEDDNDGKESDDEPDDPVQVPGAVLKLKGVPKETKFYSIKKVFAQHAKVIYVENVNEELESFVRFAESGDAKSALEKARIANDEDVAKVEIDGNDVVVEVLEGDEERQFWLNSQKTRAQFIADRKKSRGRQSGRGRQKGSWQRGGNKRHHRSGHSESTGPKQIKTEPIDRKPVKTEPV